MDIFSRNGKAHLDLCENLCCCVHVLVVADGPPRHDHGDNEDHDVGADNDRHWTHEGPDEALFRGEPTVGGGAVTPEVQRLIADDADDDHHEGQEVAGDVVGDDAKPVCSPHISQQLVNVKP